MVACMMEGHELNVADQVK